MLNHPVENTQATNKPSLFASLFTIHPHSVNETYWQHCLFAARFAGLLLLAATAALVHALIPALCQTTASRIIKSLHHNMTHRNHLTE